MCANISLAREKLNFQPTISLEVGLLLTLEHDPKLKSLA
jgi:nucleoside-diphosphate-sugar epimerase